MKCKKAGIECHQKRPLRWVEGAEYRRKAKKRASDKDEVDSRANSIPLALNDPSSAHLDRAFQYYLYYCKDLFLICGNLDTNQYR